MNREALEGWFRGTTRELPRQTDDPELLERQRVAAAQEAAAHAHDEAQRTDTVTTHVAEVKLSDWFGGGLLRDRTGSVKVGADGQPLSHDPHERVPDRLDETQTAALFGVAPAPKPNREPTAEEALAAQAREEADRKKRAALLAKV